MQTIAFGALNIVPVPMMADIIDYDILKTGANRSAQYISTLTLMTKCNAAFGGAVGFFLLGFFGFDPKSTTHTPEAVNALMFTYVAIPFILQISAAILAWRFPIDERRQKIIRKRIEQRALRAEKNDATA